VFPEPPLKWFGGKAYLADKIHAAAPPMGSYKMRGIPYGGALQEVWSWKYQGVSEVVNDLDLRLTNLWHCLKVRSLFEELRRELELTPFGRPFWDGASQHMRLWDKHEVEWAEKLDKQPSPFWAAMFYVLVRQSRGGDQSAFAPLSSKRTRRGMNEQASAWWNAIAELPAVHARLARVVVERMDALAFMRKYDGPDTFYYADPPYLPDAKATKQGYRYEMTVEQHEAMLTQMTRLKARVLVSGYASDLYDTVLDGWERLEYEVTDNASQSKAKKRKVEVMWRNYDAEGVPLA
jgi:DNA adenine methylase